MFRRFLLPALALTLVAAEAATAQPSDTKPAASAYGRSARRPGHVLTAREQRAADAAAKAAAAAIPATAVPATASTSWSGWSDAEMPAAREVGNGQYRPTSSLSVAPGMPINQVGHGVTTDYNGRPLRRPEVASTTIAPRR